MDCSDASASSIEQMVSWKAYAYSFAALVAASYYYFPAASAGGSSGGTTIDGLSFPALKMEWRASQALTGGGSGPSTESRRCTRSRCTSTAPAVLRRSPNSRALRRPRGPSFTLRSPAGAVSQQRCDRTQPFIRPMISLTLLVYFFYVRSRAHARSAVPPLCHLRRDGERPRRGDGQAPLQRCRPSSARR